MRGDDRRSEIQGHGACEVMTEEVRYRDMVHAR